MKQQSYSEPAMTVSGAVSFSACSAALAAAVPAGRCSREGTASRPFPAPAGLPQDYCDGEHGGPLPNPAMLNSIPALLKPVRVATNRATREPPDTFPVTCALSNKTLKSCQNSRFALTLDQSAQCQLEALTLTFCLSKHRRSITHSKAETGR